MAIAGEYSDAGKSATSTAKCSDFQVMIDACMAGKIDMVITKSISRFARNTVDSLIHIRKLKETNIAVFFEKEGINTLEGSGELLITILSSQAQEESRSNSENCHWGIVPQYYIEDNHEAIISKELFHRVQEKKARRFAIYRPAAKKKDEPVKGKYSSKYVLSDICVCAECGQPYRRQVWLKYG